MLSCTAAIKIYAILIVFKTFINIFAKSGSRLGKT